jgi:hypothetical protein
MRSPKSGGGFFVTGYTILRNPYLKWEPYMPRIRDEVLDCVIYLYSSEDDAEKGVRTGGSGFLAAVPSEIIPKRQHPYVVSNRHVVEGGNTCVRLNTIDDRLDVIPLTEQDWFLSDQDDLAIARMPALDHRRFQRKWVNIDQMLSIDTVEKYDFGLGEECFVVGRFINHEGRQRNLPSLRFGYLAQMPWEFIRLPHGGGYIDQESFLVDIKSVGGYSGSPVFWHPLDKSVESRPGVVRDKFFLLGVDWGNLCHWSDVCDASGRPFQHGLKVDINTGMMAVVPAWKLISFLQSDEQREMRKQIDEEFIRTQGLPPASPNVSNRSEEASSEKEDYNPHHREDFNGLLDVAAQKPKRDDQT